MNNLGPFHIGKWCWANLFILAQNLKVSPSVLIAAYGALSKDMSDGSLSVYTIEQGFRDVDFISLALEVSMMEALAADDQKIGKIYVPYGFALEVIAAHSRGYTEFRVIEMNHIDLDEDCWNVQTIHDWWVKVAYGYREEQVEVEVD